MWFSLAVLTLVVVISARFLLVTGYPRTATADPKAAAGTSAPNGAPSVTGGEAAKKTTSDESASRVAK
jgi:hypothetical protein